ncbi:hypothetical protein [Streptomyces sp. NPDC056401]|uniref:hypothetical protein n=1 Tax=Streptomyces sp. NPDC056401 TaxID=3345809 RepID=UPI0035E30335
MTPEERRDLFKRTRASKQTHFGVELWSRDGVRICEITPYVRNLYWVEERNEAEVLQFSLDLDAFEDYMIKEVGADPVSNFREGQTEIKVKERRGTGPWVYLFGTQIFYAPINLNNDGSLSISVNAHGYLNFFKDRYPNPAVKYTGVESVQISRNLITQAQSVTDGDYGIILPAGGYYTTTKIRDKTFEQYTSSTKLQIQRLTALNDGTFDFKFLPDKTYMTYPAIGSPRTDFRIVFDRKNFRSSVDSGILNRGANNLYNLIHGIGSGFGADQLITHQSDVASQHEFKVRELPVQFNEVSNIDTLIENAQARLERVKQLLRMPQFTMSGADLPDNRLEIGDVVPVVMTGRRLLEDMTGLYRVERLEVHVDDNHFLQAVTPYFEKTGDYA